MRHSFLVLLTATLLLGTTAPAQAATPAPASADGLSGPAHGGHGGHGEWLGPPEHADPHGAPPWVCEKLGMLCSAP